MAFAFRISGLYDSIAQKGAPRMTLFQLLIVALIQGVTEFLPVSSSGHLILLPTLTGTPDQGLAIDVAVHVGTLLAVILYFRAAVRIAEDASSDGGEQASSDSCEDPSKSSTEEKDHETTA